MLIVGLLVACEAGREEGDLSAAATADDVGTGGMILADVALDVEPCDLVVLMAD